MRRWLTKDEKRLLKAHADRYQAMGSHLQEATTEHLYELLGACKACTTSNCWWAEYAAAQYLMDQIRGELAWRNRRDAEQADPVDDMLARMADDGARIHD